jgi:hypothetical protein
MFAALVESTFGEVCMNAPSAVGSCGVRLGIAAQTFEFSDRNDETAVEIVAAVYAGPTMAKHKKYRLADKDIRPLVNHSGGCIASDRITVDGLPVGYMYREPPDEAADTGWRFMAGDESQEYMDEAANHGVYAVNTIANYDQDILPFVDAPIGSAFGRNPETGRFEPVESPVDPDDCLHPDFPVVTGDYQLTDTWSLSLPLKFNRRIEDGSLILWRPGLTIYFTAWNNDHQESVDVRLAKLKSLISPNAFESRESKHHVIAQFSYRLVEDSVNVLYGFAINDDGHLQVALYFDDESDIDLAHTVFDTIKNAPQ